MTSSKCLRPITTLVFPNKAKDFPMQISQHVQSSHAELLCIEQMYRSLLVNALVSYCEMLPNR